MTFRCQRIETGLAIVFADSPLGLDEVFVFEALQSKVEGAVIDEEHFFRLALNGARYALPVTGAEQERFKVGLSTTIFVLQFQRDLAIARGNELRAIVDYNKSLSNLTRNKAVTLERYNMVLQ